MAWFFGKNRGADLVVKVKALQGLKRKHNLECLDQFYVYLTILDSKATGLLTVNALFIAILVVFLASGESIAERWQIRFSREVVELQLILVGLSALLCLLVMRVSWSFLAKVPTAPTESAHFEDELTRLANVIDDRTHYYWIAWLFALAALMLTLAWWSLCLAAVAAVVLILWALGRG